MSIDPTINVFMDSAWSCHVCHRVRPDSLIAVRKVVVTGERPAQPTVVVNVRYCADTPSCYDGTLDVSFVQAAIKAFGS